MLTMGYTKYDPADGEYHDPSSQAQQAKSVLADIQRLLDTGNS